MVSRTIHIPDCIIVGVSCIVLLGCLQYSFAVAEAVRHDPSIVLNTEPHTGADNTTIGRAGGSSCCCHQHDLVRNTGKGHGIIPVEADAARITHLELSYSRPIRIADCSGISSSPTHSDTLPMGAARFRIKHYRSRHDCTTLDKITRWMLAPLFFIAAHPMPVFIISILLLIGAFAYVGHRVSKKRDSCPPFTER